MRILLDTDAFIWWDDESRELVEPLRQAISDPANDIYVSAASIWENAIKRRRGRLAFAGSVVETVLKNGFAALPMTAVHAERAGDLAPHHRDPFDRMLIAQTIVENMTLGTQDKPCAPTAS